MRSFITIDPWGGDVPGVVVSVGKDTFSVVHFTNRCEFVFPIKSRDAIYPSGPAAAAEDGVSLEVKPWTWWIILDGIKQIGVDFNSLYDSYELEISTHNPSSGNVIFRKQISQNVAKALYSSLRNELRSDSLREDLHPGTTGIFEPMNIALKFPVTTTIYRVSEPVELTTAIDGPLIVSD